MFRVFLTGLWSYSEPHIRERGGSRSPELWAFAPGAPSVPACLIIHHYSALRVRIVLGWLNASASKASGDGTSSHHWILIPIFSYISGLSLLTSEALFPLFHVTSNRNHNLKANGYRMMRSEGTEQKWFSPCFHFCVWLSKGMIPPIGPDELNSLPFFHFLVFLKFIQL